MSPLSCFLFYKFSRIDNFCYLYCQAFFKTEIMRCPEACASIVPKDTKIKKQWLALFLAYGSNYPERCNFVVRFCHVICDNNATEFGKDDLKNFCAKEVLELFDEAFDELLENGSRKEVKKMIDYFEQLLSFSMMAKKGIVKIWKSVSEQLADKWFIAQFLVTIINKSTSFVDFLEDEESRSYVEYVKEALRPHLNNTNYKKLQKEMKQTIRYLEALIESLPLQPSTSKQSLKPVKTSEASKSNPEADETDKEVRGSFKAFVSMLLSNEMSTMMLNLNDPRKDAEYFFKHAVRDELTAMKFSVSIESIDSKEFNVELMDLIDIKFRKQHNPLTQRRFPKNEVLTTVYFINQLMLSKIVTPQMVESLVNYATIQPGITELSKQCVESMKQNSSVAGMYWMFTDPKKKEEKSNIK